MAKTLKGSMMVVVPRVNLVSDIAERIGPEASIFCASLGKKEIGKITVGTIQSLKAIPIQSDLIILDEVHRYKEDVLNTLNYKFLVGMTATPYDSSGFIYGDNKFWSKPCYEYLIGDAIENKFLCPYRIYSSENAYTFKKSYSRGDYTQSEIDTIIKTKKVSVILDEVKKICNAENRKQVMILCSSIKHAEDVANELDDCVVVHSKLKDAKEKIEEVKKSKYRFVVSVMMLAEGFDHKFCDCIVYLRPTKSTLLMQQSAGRGLRFAEGKDDCILLDYGHVFSSCGTPSKPIYNFLPVKEKQEALEQIKTCDECYFVYDKGPQCPACGHINANTIDPNRNLVDSITRDSTEIIWLDESHFIRTGKRNGQWYAFYVIDKQRFFFYGQYFRKASKKQRMKVKYQKTGKSNKILSVDLF